MNGFHLIPEHMRDGLKLYLLQGIQPGSFLTAVLENDLVGAATKADHINQGRLREWAEFLYWHAPSIPVRSWGSREDVSHWIKSGGARGLGLNLRETSE